jgi:hypothetical protein
MENKVQVEFQGPFSWLGQDDTKSIFTVPEGELSGIYLWTVKIDEGELVYYVGKTNRNFSRRMREHLKEHLAGFYYVNSPLEFAKGIKNPLWKGMYGRRNSPTPIDLVKIYPTISRPIIEIAKIYRFFIAPLTSERRILERLESALAKYLSGQPGKVGEFQEPGVNYSLRFGSEKPKIALFTSSVKILGLPNSLEI